MIAVVDYGAGNLRNVCKALEHVGARIELTDEPAALQRADKIVLPGVGAFADCLQGLQSRGLFEPLRELALAGKPLLGICVGMQLLMTVGEEMGEWPGLDLIPGRVVRFQFEGRLADEHPLKVPHIGWNQITPVRLHPLLAGVQAGSYAYFVHSYHPVPSDPAHVVAVTEYGYPFPSVIARDTVWGIQFHPEKSQDTGLAMLRNFVRF
ncbi:MAG: imidazole glycerol phosphate synthase subunit HisH [Anaerolineae bacterium]|nr:imidazole glycerol phosphate synthase subunit HisH [Thermoflexales bacterium]MDW8408738.1 imidazole glycerol phosphate synthase subunit HisH [Anaerolineae bacterium]